ncbi:trichohyalin-like [Sardina pilchardus]|uniref:trichohyalin-like n=1 Tax=Sardina pilchardus TaxID=27697 RepID=UPI002E11585B
MEESVQALEGQDTSRRQLESLLNDLQRLRTHLQEKERGMEERNKQLMEREAKLFVSPDPFQVRRARSMDIWNPAMQGESPGPAPPISPAVSDLRLVLLGGSAAGKRAAGNTILGTYTLTHTSTETQHSESRKREVAGRRVTMVDTPDWFCSGLSEKDMRQDVGLCVRLSAPGPHAFLLVIPVESSEGEERRMLEKMEDIFGEGCWGHTLILLTHAEGLRERSVEELLQTGSPELQQLVEKCGNRCHLLNIKDRPDDTKITQLLEKIEEMVSGNRKRFYSSETYQEAERQLREIERRMQKEREVEERKLREERERKEEHDKNMQQSMKKMEGEIQQHETEIRELNEKTKYLERKMKDERDEEKKREIERELNREITLREEMERKLSRVKEKREREKREMEDRHREEMEEMRESYEKEARVEAERDLMKIILPELQKNISISKQKMEAEFNRQMEEKNRELEEKKQQIEEKSQHFEMILQELRQKEKTINELRLGQSDENRSMEVAIVRQAQNEGREQERMDNEEKRDIERMKQMLDEKERELKRMRLKPRQAEHLTNDRLKQITFNINREMDTLRKAVNTHLDGTQLLLKEICKT